MTGIASSRPPYRESVTVVMKGSVTPKVMGTRSPGSGALAISSSSEFCQKHSPAASASTATETMIRVRSSSRCSTSVRCSSNRAVLRRAMAAYPPTRLRSALGYDLALDGLFGLGLGGFLELRRLRRDVVFVLLAAHRRLELADAPAHGAPQLRQPLWPEDHEGDDEDDRQFQWSDVRHRANGTRVVARTRPLRDSPHMARVL